MGVCTKERKGVAAEVLMATPCTNSLGGESEGHKHETQAICFLPTFFCGRSFFLQSFPFPMDGDWAGPQDRLQW